MAGTVFRTGTVPRQWWMRTDFPVSRKGRGGFHGFFGEYKITAAEHGREINGTFTFDARTRQPVELRLS